MKWGASLLQNRPSYRGISFSSNLVPLLNCVASCGGNTPSWAPEHLSSEKALEAAKGLLSDWHRFQGDIVSNDDIKILENLRTAQDSDFSLTARYARWESKGKEFEAHIENNASYSSVKRKFKPFAILSM